MIDFANEHKRIIKASAFNLQPLRGFVNGKCHEEKKSKTLHAQNGYAIQDKS